MSSLLDLANLDLASTPGVAPPTPEAPKPPTGPIPTAQRARVVGGLHTEVLVQAYADRIFVLVTQLGRIGCLIQVNPPPPTIPAPLPSLSHSLFPHLPPPHPSTTLTPLFGVPPNQHAAVLHELYAMQVGAIVFAPRDAGEEGFARSRPVLLGIALKGGKEGEGVSEQERSTFGEVMEMVMECAVCKPVVISPITEDDLAEVVVLKRKAYRTAGPTTIAVYGKVSDADFDAESLVSLRAGLASPHEVLLKATRDGVIVAFASWILPHPTEPVEIATELVLPPGTDKELYNSFFPRLAAFKASIQEPHYRLNSLGTDPALQRTGAGTALTRWGLALADHDGLPTHLNSARAGEALYLREGFVPYADRITSVLNPDCSVSPPVWS
ncbi:hypothetical protein RQP46_009585 [Phenoliferia psychrophenolica]